MADQTDPSDAEHHDDQPILRDPAHPDKGTGTAVVFIDLQEGFFEDPALRDNRELMVLESNRLAELARSGGHEIVVVTTVHDRRGSTWTLKMLEDGQGFNFEGSEKTSLVDGVDLEPAVHIRKTRDSAFHGTALAQRLRTMGVQRLVLAGVTAESCVAATGRDAFAHDFEVFYARETIASSDSERGWRSVDESCETYRQTVLDRPDLERLLRGDQD